MKISPADIAEATHKTITEVAICRKANQPLSEIAKPIVTGYQVGFAPVINRSFSFFILAVLLFVTTLVVLT